MKKLVILTMLIASNVLLAADDTSKFSVSSYVTVRSGEAPLSGDYNGGVGLEAAISLSKTFAVVVHGNIENDLRGVLVDEAGATVKVSPFNIQAFTPYVRLGYAYSFNSLNHYGVGGVGGEVVAYKSIKLFSDINWYTDVEDLKHNGHAVVRIGGGISF